MIGRTGIIFIFIFFTFVQLKGQSHISRQIEDLEKNFRSFQYEKVLEKGNFLLSDPYVTKNDSLQILKYMLNSAYALADTIEARKIIHKIIKCDPNFALNPMETSPKIIEFYEHVKKQVKAHKPLVPAKPVIRTVIQPMPLPTLSSFLSLLLPGSGHLHQKFKKKGWLFSGISGAVLSGIIYSTIKTSKTRQDYLAARPGDDFNKLYKEYNNYYKLRNILGAAFLIWDGYVYYDLQKEWRFRIKTHFNDKALSMQISWHF